MGDFARLLVAQPHLKRSGVKVNVNVNFEIDTRGGHCQRFATSLVVSLTSHKVSYE